MATMLTDDQCEAIRRELLERDRARAAAALNRAPESLTLDEIEMWEFLESQRVFDEEERKKAGPAR